MNDTKNFLALMTKGRNQPIFWAEYPVRPHFKANSDSTAIHLRSEFAAALARELNAVGGQNVDELCKSMSGVALDIAGERALARRTCAFALRYIDTLITERVSVTSPARANLSSLVEAIETGRELPQETLTGKLTSDEHISQTFYHQLARSTRDFELGRMTFGRTSSAIVNALVWTSSFVNMPASAVFEPLCRFLKRNV